MRALLLASSVLVGCGFEHGKLPNTVIDAPVVDTLVVDAPIDAPMMGVVCLGSGAYEACFDSPTSAVTLSGTIDTDTSSLCAQTQPAGWVAAGQPPSCFVVGTSITAGSVTAGGSRPLVLFATGTITVGGTLDVSSHRGVMLPGPGAPSPLCQAFTQTPGNNSSGAAGGAGATFMSQGGNGGDGSGTNADGRAPMPGPAPTHLRAGCSGQRGGTGDDAPGTPGVGGGAVYLVAGGTITIGGAINASGAGAANGDDNATKSGGSGGGSGGMIKLHAAALDATGTLMANGGGGASGADESGGGNFGMDPTSPLMRAAGGASVSGSGVGGGGFAGGMGAQNGGPGNANNTGGGGGGGGGGYIESNLPLTGAIVSAGLVVP